MAVLLLALPLAASAGDAPPRWDWTQSNRYYLESQVRLPLFMWFAAPFNKQARATAFEVRIVTTCDPGEMSGKSAWEVWCTLDDVSLLASGVAQEEGLLAPVVLELDEILTGAALQLTFREDGRLANVDLEEVERRNQRFGRINENMRLVLIRAFAGLDLQLPAADDAKWAQYGSWLMRAPAADGSSGLTELVHEIVSDEDGVVAIVSGGRGTIVPGEGENKYETRMSGTAVLDTRTGRLLDREWIVVGVPTASSWIAFGAAGYPYIQQGRVVALGEDQAWNVGESRELPPGTAAQTAIQQSLHLGTASPTLP